MLKQTEIVLSGAVFSKRALFTKKNLIIIVADLQVFPDMFTRREVQSFVVHCTFMDDGCSWKGEIRNLEVSILITKNEVKLIGCASSM